MDLPRLQATQGGRGVNTTNHGWRLLPRPLQVIAILLGVFLFTVPTPVRGADGSFATPSATAFTPPVSVGNEYGGEAGQPVVWTQLGVDGRLLARAVVAADCPTISLDGHDTTMTVRTGPTGTAFADTVCEAIVPLEVKTAEIGPQMLALLPERISTLAILGDTGCRISVWDALQSCESPNTWALPDIARAIEESRPHLIVHVGDLIYRESPCPPGETSCAGSPFGDNQATWQADVFDPLARLLPTAPWVFLRGNHETCSREGLGWFRYFDPRPMPETCQRFTEPYAIDFPGLPWMIVMDTAEAGDTKTTADLNETYAGQLTTMATLSKPGSWLLTHKPVAGGILDLGNGEQLVDTATFAAISTHPLPDNLVLVVSGHIHLAEALVFAPQSGIPAQLISGNGGTELDRGISGVYEGAVLGNPSVALGIVDASSGWMTIQVADHEMTATALDARGREAFVIHLARN